MSKINTKLFFVGGYGDFVIRNIYKDLKSTNPSIECISVNTDSQSQESLPEGVTKINISETGHGAGGKPEVAYEFLQSYRQRIQSSLEGSDIVFVIAGLGKGTGTGAGLATLEICKNAGIYTVACLRTPEESDGALANGIAREYLAKYNQCVDASCVISNDTCITIATNKGIQSIGEAYAHGNNSAFDTIRGLISIVENVGERNVDLEDFKRTISGKFAVTVSPASEVNTDFSLFDVESSEAKTALSVIEYPSQSQASLLEVMEAKARVREALNPEVAKIDGLIANPNINQTQVILVVSGFEKTLSDKRREAGLKGLQIRYNLANSSKLQTADITA